MNKFNFIKCCKYLAGGYLFISVQSPMRQQKIANNTIPNKPKANITANLPIFAKHFSE